MSKIFSNVNLGPVVGSTTYSFGGFMTPFLVMGVTNLLVSIAIMLVLQEIGCSRHSRNDKDSRQANITIAIAATV